MVVCRKSARGVEQPRPTAVKSNGGVDRRSRLGEGGPVFLPRRRPSAMAEALLAQAMEVGGVTAYDDVWFAGRPSH